MKLGKLPASPSPQDLMFAQFRTATPLPPHPRRFGNTHLANKQKWEMLGNDSAGCCVWSAAAHITNIWFSDRGQKVEFTKESVLSDYSAVTGYDPTTGENDNGTDMRVALNYWRKTGILDAAGNRHKIGAFVKLEPGNIEDMLEAFYLFGSTFTGIEFPASAMDQFNANEVWDIQRGSPIDGGHAICLASRYNYMNFVTWGQSQGCTQRFITTYCDEAWAILSQEMLNGEGLSPEHFDLPALQQYLAAL